MVSAITEAVISTVNGVGRILYLRPFNEHVGTSVTDGPNIQDIVRGSRAFRTTSAEIGGKVEADFAEAEVYAYHSTMGKPKRWARLRAFLPVGSGYPLIAHSTNFILFV